MFLRFGLPPVGLDVAAQEGFKFFLKLLYNKCTCAINTILNGDIFIIRVSR